MVRGLREKEMALVSSHERFRAYEELPLSPKERLASSGGWWTVLLALLMLGSLAECVQAAAWSEGLEVVRLALMAGGVLGIALALTRFSSTFATLYGIVTGVFWVALSLQRVLFPSLGTHDAVQELILRNAGWLVVLLRGGPGADNLVFVTQLSFLGWWLGFFATWNLFRYQRVLYAVVPAGFALVINLYFSPINLNGYLLVFLVTVLLIAARIELAKNETRWQLSRIRYAPDIYLDFLKAGVGFAVVVVLLSWTMPDVASRANIERLVRPFERPWKTVENTWSRMYQSLNYPGVASTVTRYGKALALGGPVSLSDRPIFEAEFLQRTYWRAVLYDRYDGRGWTDTNQEASIIEHGQWLGEPLFAATSEITATVQPLEAGQDVIVSPPQPIRVSLPVDADYSRITQDGSLVNVSRMRSRVGLGPRVRYRVVSAVTQAAAESLQIDTQAYPAWITERYLQLPETLPRRVVELANQIAAPHTNPYDKAQAIESYLRQYPYETNIAAPPEGRDAVDYFLFDIKQGYCDYYASAMAVMLRAIGIPSRLAAGYAPGELLPWQDDKPVVTDTYRVVERDAHAWVEVFFPTYGWIQFEPTAAQPQVLRPLAAVNPEPNLTPTPPVDEEDLRDLRNTSPPETTPLSTGSPSALVRWVGLHRSALAAVIALLVLAAAVALLLRWRRQVFLRSPELVANLFALVGTWATRLRIPWPASDTPLERARRFGRRIPAAKAVAGLTADLFVAQRYGRQRPSAATLVSLARQWQGLQPTLWKQWLRQVLSVHAVTSPSESQAPAGRAPQRWDLEQGQPSGTPRRR
jgi:transglutaminase-like putative cysteine protease